MPDSESLQLQQSFDFRRTTEFVMIGIGGRRGMISFCCIEQHKKAISVVICHRSEGQTTQVKL